VSLGQFLSELSPRITPPPINYRPDISTGHSASDTSPPEISSKTISSDGLDLSDLKNYRPVSNLPFLSKLLERVVQARLLVHLNGYNLLPCWQSAYCRFTYWNGSRRFSTTCWWQSIGGRCLFSASLVYQLPSILWTTTCCCNDSSVRFGLCGRVLQWICSYLSGRTFRVVYSDVMSFIVYVTCSVSQGSVPWSAVFHFVHGGSSGPGRSVRRRVFSCLDLCWWHTTVHPRVVTGTRKFDCTTNFTGSCPWPDVLQDGSVSSSCRTGVCYACDSVSEYTQPRYASHGGAENAGPENVHRVSGKKHPLILLAISWGIVVWFS